MLLIPPLLPELLAAPPAPPPNFDAILPIELKIPKNLNI